MTWSAVRNLHTCKGVNRRPRERGAKGTDQTTAFGQEAYALIHQRDARFREAQRRKGDRLRVWGCELPDLDVMPR